MSELFIRTNKFLKEFQENLNLEVSALSFESSSDEYFNIDDTEEKIKYLLWESPSKYYSLGARLDYKEIFKKEHKELNDKGFYFHYCKFKTYERTYKDRLNNFKEKYEDADPVYFLQDELTEYLKPIDFEQPFKSLDLEQQKVLGFTRDRIVRFLVEQAKILGYNITINVDEFEWTMSYEIEDIKSENDSLRLKANDTINNIKSLKWQGTELQLTELAKALKESNLLNPELSQKAIFERFKEFMQVENFNEADKLKEIRKRTKDKTPLLNILETSLNNWIHRKD
mgnify:CR=1 FL=1|tara:strand:+ start:451 stop:1302 length:852 start_codon:yes stop_codon:yes gene_type:complete